MPTLAASAGANARCTEWRWLFFGVALSLVGVFSLAIGSVVAAAAETGPVATAAWRVGIAAFLFGLLALAGADRGYSISLAIGEPRVLLAGLCFAGVLASWYTAQRLSSVANAGVLLNLAPVIIAFGGWLLFHQVLRWPMIWGLTLAVMGAALLVDDSRSAGAGTHAIGDALALVGAGFYAAYFVLVGNTIRRLDFAGVMCALNAAAAVSLAVVALMSDEALVPATGNGWVMLAGVAVLGSVVGQGIVALAMRFVAPIQVATTILLEPVFAGALAAVVLSQALSDQQLLAGAMALAGVALCQIFGNARRVAPADASAPGR